ncbi:MAG: GNAT family N-acetyltransferase [Promethearchaeota archaeon]
MVSLSEENIKEVHAFCEANVEYLTHSEEIFRSATMGSEYFLPEYSIVVVDEKGEIIAFFMVVFRAPFLFKKRRVVAVLKFFVVRKDWRKRGMGSKLLNLLIERIKSSDKKCFRMKFEVICAMPDYWLPGLDPRHTEAFFFLRKHGFNRKGERLNLSVELEEFPAEAPPSRMGLIKISRATREDEAELVPLSFMPRMYQVTSWPVEVKMSFQNDPITSFIARDSRTNKIIGWATHSVSFPGSFGPTGVSKKYRGQGVGSVLLKWCLWDLKQKGLKRAIIRWVNLDTAHFYLKSVNAHISELYWPMQRRI